jgi:hypothetical protein
MCVKQGYKDRAKEIFLQGYATDGQIGWLAIQLRKADRYDVLVRELEEAVSMRDIQVILKRHVQSVE